MPASVSSGGFSTILWTDGPLYLLSSPHLRFIHKFVIKLEAVNETRMELFVGKSHYLSIRFFWMNCSNTTQGEAVTYTHVRKLY